MGGETDRLEGELKGQEGKLTDDEMREKQGRGPRSQECPAEGAHTAPRGPGSGPENPVREPLVARRRALDGPFAAVLGCRRPG